MIKDIKVTPKDLRSNPENACLLGLIKKRGWKSGIRNMPDYCYFWFQQVIPGLVVQTIFRVSTIDPKNYRIDSGDTEFATEEEAVKFIATDRRLVNKK